MTTTNQPAKPAPFWDLVREYAAEAEHDGSLPNSFAEYVRDLALYWAATTGIAPQQWVAYDDDSLRAHGPFSSRSAAVQAARRLTGIPRIDEAELQDNGWTFVPLLAPRK